MIECRRISTPSCSASSAALRSGRTLKPMMMAFDAEASSTSLSVMAPTPEWMTLMRTFSVDIFCSESASTCDRTLHVALEDERQFLDAGLLDLLGQAFERDARALRQLRLALLHLAVLRDALGLVAIGNDQEGIARIGNAFEAEDFDRRRGPGFFDGASAVVEHGADLAEGVAHDEAVLVAQRSVLHEHGGHGAASAVELGFDDGADGRSVRAWP